MEVISLASETDFDGWRAAARRLFHEQVAPEDVMWRTPETETDLFAPTVAPSPAAASSATARALSVPTGFIRIAQRATAHRDPTRFALLYRLLWRMQDNRALLDIASDPDVAWLRQRDQAIRRDIHKMHAFVRFRRAGASADGRECYAAWFEPTHRIAALAAPFFQSRFTQVNWRIVTPDLSVAWDGEHLTEGPGGDPRDVPDDDAVEQSWNIYYSSIFNPARLKVRMMQSQMPKKYWRNLPEAQLIPQLIAEAQSRRDAMIADGVTAPNPRSLRVQARRQANAPAAPAPTSIDDVRHLSVACQRCPLHTCATQTVFGEGPSDAHVMIVGEQPGDEEDIAGHPFVGPAGNVLDACLKEAGIERSTTWLTNAVKHFKYTPRGKRRVHERPNAGEIDTCRWWLDQERSLIRPRVIITMGATAFRGVTGASTKISDVRGTSVQLDDGSALRPTVHPAYLLRLPDEASRAHARQQFIADLRAAAQSA